ncbi:uncharacterized protein LOC107714293 [Sinocyclocheilus rhinocerous]|uniref:uncharacterized protein LOC107714293 n=1 Tax=Sinocyclocheilus rhinocerous TaxID=307959 RepID=UPI0007B82F3C|nr:PREDICTED: uncharacterized protein LOC107714293 [Sinocyclocheilus rhinocerous]XP_016375593.1 PREDICTED: uncharacterized protein LOC107714293 [Sinocyclocheilus rhinocerous]
MDWICPGPNCNPSPALNSAYEQLKVVEEIWRRRTEMAGPQRRGSEGRRKAKKRKHSHSKSKSKESQRTRLTVNLHWCLMFFLLFFLPRASSLTVTGQKDGYITLPCNSSYRGDLSTVLVFGSTTAYGNHQNEHFRGRVHKSGNCDLILQPLKTTDAGKYTLHVNANGQPKSYSYDVHVNVNLTARVGEEVKFDYLPRDAESVKHFTNTDLIDVWRREQGFLTDRLTDKNGRPTIKNFTSSDAGTYRVLNKTGGILVTVTVTTESGTASKDKQDRTRDDKTDGTERAHVCPWSVIGVVGVLIIVFIVFMIHQYRKKNKEHDSYLEGPNAVNRTGAQIT